MNGKELLTLEEIKFIFWLEDELEENDCQEYDYEKLDLITRERMGENE